VAITQITASITTREVRMKKIRLSMLGVLAVASLLLGVSASLSQQEERKGKNEALAQKLVGQCLPIHEGDIVLINGGVRDVELLEDLAVQVRKVGAFPLITLGSDRLARRMYTNVPEKYDTQAPDLDLRLMNMVTAIISVDYSATETALAGIPPSRVAARANAALPVTDVVVKRGVLGLSLGNNLYPTAELAKRFGMSQQDLSKIFWDAVNVDYAKLQSTAGAIKEILAGGKEIHITNPSGTDLKLRIEGRPVFASVGVVSSEDAKKGYAASQVYLPAGEVFLAPVLGTAEGTVVADKQYFQGKEISGLKLTFKEGKLVSMTAKSGLEPIKAFYDASGSGKELFGVIDLGINPSIHSGPGSKLLTWVPAGMVTVNLGNNVWAGGDNNTGFGLSSFLPGSTVKVDEKTLVENGVAKF
jgi:aminopeptidase